MTKMIQLMLLVMMSICCSEQVLASGEEVDAVVSSSASRPVTSAVPNLPGDAVELEAQPSPVLNRGAAPVDIGADNGVVASGAPISRTRSVVLWLFKPSLGSFLFWGALTTVAVIIPLYYKQDILNDSFSYGPALLTGVVTVRTSSGATN